MRALVHLWRRLPWARRRLARRIRERELAIARMDKRALVAVRFGESYGHFQTELQLQRQGWPPPEHAAAIAYKSYLEYLLWRTRR